ncbi:PQQ-dependent sugar dehydrogenase, partial [Nocardia sp. NPDC004722]
MSFRIKALALFAALAAILISVVALPTATAAIDPAEFAQVQLARGGGTMGEPIAIALLPDDSVLHIDRAGSLHRTTNDGTTGVIGSLDVYIHDESGLLGLAVDPGFDTNRA